MLNALQTPVFGYPIVLWFLSLAYGFVWIQTGRFFFKKKVTVLELIVPGLQMAALYFVMWLQTVKFQYRPFIVIYGLVSLVCYCLAWWNWKKTSGERVNNEYSYTTYKLSVGQLTSFPLTLIRDKFQVSGVFIAISSVWILFFMVLAYQTIFPGEF